MLHQLNYDSASDCPLDDIKVLDLSRLVAGNMLSLLLADFGADVIKVENPQHGDTLRHWKDHTKNYPSGISTYWKVYGRNKKSLTLNLRDTEAMAIMRRLIKTAHVLIESFKPGTLEKMGLSPDELFQLNPALVIVRVSGWGQTGPYKDQPGFGSLVEAMSGFAAKNGFESHPPMLPNLALADMVAGLYGAYATLVAVRVASGQGQGQVIDLSLLEPLFSILGPDAAQFQLTGQTPARTGNRTSISAPRNTYQTKDGKYVALSASVQSMTERLFIAIGREDLIHDPRFKTNADRLQHVDALDQIVQTYVSQYNQNECLQYFRKQGITVGPVYDVSELIQDEHVIDREVVVRLPDQDIGEILMHNIIPRLSNTPGRLRRPAPDLGEHTNEILHSVDITDQEIIQLKARGAI